jgi:nitrogen fixation protein NifU and related proteins
MYHEHIMDHYRHPRNRGSLEGPDVSLTDSNPTCGDEINVSMRIKDGKIIEARQFTVGCAISQAGASMLFERIEGRTVADVVRMPKEEILEEFGTELSVSRVKCALLALTAAKKALVEQEAKQGPMQDAGGQEHNATDN